MPKPDENTGSILSTTQVSSVNHTHSNEITTSRRGFLQLGLVASTSLTLAASIANASTHFQPNNMAQNDTTAYRFLDTAAAEFFTALFPVVLAKKSLDKTTSDHLLLALDDLIYHFNAFNQKQMQQLFDVMAFAPVRLVAGAQWASWTEANSNDVQAFLVGWRDSRFELKRMGYLSICKVINLCWYAREDAFADIGYPGPPVKIPTQVTRSKNTSDLFV